MTEVLLDTSALLALVFDEAGSERVRQDLPDGTISAVNVAEFVSKLTDHGYAGEIAEALFRDLMVDSRDFSTSTACLSGRLRPSTRRHGLSLGDRACLAEAIAGDLPVLTADRAWADLDLAVDVEVIR